MSIRFVSLIMSFIILLSVFSVGCGKPTVINETVSLAPIGADGTEKLDANPDRGFRTEFYIMLKKTKVDGVTYDSRTVFVDQSEEEIRASLDYIFKIYIYSKPVKAKLALAYIYLTDWRDEELSENFYRFLDIYFTMCREQGIKNMLRFCYCSNHNDLTQCANQQTMIRHIKQLEAPIAKYADTIHTIETGFVGAYGEWASVYQVPPVDYATVIKAITERLAVPNELYFSIGPLHKSVIGTPETYEHYWSIGQNSDAIYGYFYSKEDRAFRAGTEEWLRVEREAAYTPQGGEMHVNVAMVANDAAPSGISMILQLYHHRHTTFSVWHGYLEALSVDNIMTRWQNETLTPDILNEWDIIHDPNWFYDKNGNPVERNPYEFIKDHLGYRLVADSVTVNWSGAAEDKISVDMSLKNYGFSAAFNLKSGFAILDKDYRVVAEVETGEPKTWYNRDPDNNRSTEILTHNITAELDGNLEDGTYYIAFYLRNTMGQYAALANDIQTENGYNILYSFTVK